MSIYGASARRDNAGWFFGLTGPQIGWVGASAVPCWVAMAVGRWALLLGLAPIWAVTVGLICVPVRGFSALQWLGVLLRSYLGRGLGWTRFQARAATGTLITGDPVNDGTADIDVLDADWQGLDEADLPGVLSGIQVHDGPPMSGRGVRPAVIQNHAARTWAATGRLVHPGIGMSDEAERARMAAGLSELLEASSTTNDLALIALQVRTVPDDGMQRAAWVQAHQRAAPDLSERLHAQLEDLTAGAAVRTEAFVTVVLREAAIAKSARRAGGGLTGRARTLYGYLEEIESRLVGSIGCSAVAWLDTAALAKAIRTGFEPGDAVILAQSPTDETSTARVPMSTAGPALATTAMRSYRHGDWASVCATILLPRKGAVMGALARAVVPTQPGERRALTVFFQPVAQRTAERSTDRAEMSAAMAAEMRRKVGRIERARDRTAAEKVRATDEKLERGRALVRVSSAISLTVPAQWNIPEFGRRLDASIRLCGFTPLPLDGAHDAAFAAATIPLGVGLPLYRR